MQNSHSLVLDPLEDEHSLGVRSSEEVNRSWIGSLLLLSALHHGTAANLQGYLNLTVPLLFSIVFLSGY